MQIKKLLTVPAAFVPYFKGLTFDSHDDWFCSSDPADIKVGSGGGTANILAEAWKNSGFAGPLSDWLTTERKIIIHSGGESRRLPAYSVPGKSMIPVPVFRWSNGQYVDQKLIDFQAAYYQMIMEKAGDHFCTLIGSGDVLFLSDDRFQSLPRTDILCLGLWVDDNTASKHGVFFSRKESPEKLSFMLQKPEKEKLNTLASSHYYLMDSGIWLLNARATMSLMKKCGWDDNRGGFVNGIPNYYDLYSTMGASFGAEAIEEDAGINSMDVSVIPIRNGEFYHFGSNDDLLKSCTRLQNRITDQRKLFYHDIGRHPSIFQQNARVEQSFGPDNSMIWISGSFISAGWKLHSYHILTNIPENNWDLDLPDGTCIDMLPVKGGGRCLRIYGFHDSFRGAGGKADYLGASLKDWIEKRGLKESDMEYSFGNDIFNLRLFPVATNISDLYLLAGFIISGENEEKAKELWRKCRKSSAAEIGSLADFPKLLDQSHFRSNALRKMADNHPRSIFYHLDLRYVADIYRKEGIDLPGELSDGEPIVKRISDQMFRSEVLKKTEKQLSYEQKAFSILRESIIDTVRNTPLSPHRNVLDDQILWGRSPVRLDLAGGWTDTPPYCIMNGGMVVNVSAELNGQPPLQVFARPLEEPVILLRSIDLGLKEEVLNLEQLTAYNSPGSAFSIPKAALTLAGLGNEFSGRKYVSLREQMKEIGCGIELTLLAAVPKGSGLGTSSNLAAAILGTLSEFYNLGWDNYDICHRTLVLEQMLTSGGGWQDQYGGIFPGIKILETAKGILQKPSIKWLPEILFTSPEYNEMILLYYTGITRLAKEILSEIVKGMFLNSHTHLGILDEMIHHARETYEVILKNSYEGLAEKVAISWKMNQALDSGTNPPEVQLLTRRVNDYLLGYKLLGAGGGGYLLMFAKDRKAALKVREILEKNPPNKKARFVKLDVSAKGFQISRS